MHRFGRLKTRRPAWSRAVRRQADCRGVKMPEKEVSEVERIVERLEAEGWKQQQSGMMYINGMLGTNLLKNGAVLTIQQEFHPDQEFLEQEWPDENGAEQQG